MSETPLVLIVDDNAGIRTALSTLLEVNDIESISVETPEAALAAIRTQNVAVVLQDMNYSTDTTGGDEGMALFRSIHEHAPDLPVLLMTAWTSLETAVQLVKEGAEDYFGKPWDDDKLVNSIIKLMKLRTLRIENRRLLAQERLARQKLDEEYDLCGIVYKSRQMQEVLSLALNVAKSDAAVLITGPNGSGKEKVAELIQANSRRGNEPFVTVNAGGLPDELLEAELFGAEAGAYTGARNRREGRFEAANGGTLFLDEMGNLSMKGQMKLLRVLQSGEFERLGSNKTLNCDVRIISATNADLKEEISKGSFREDLFFRLAVIEIRIPALAERPDDILPIAEAFLPLYPKADGHICSLGQKSREALLNHSWPGNVRELQNRLQRATLVCTTTEITPADLDLSPSTHSDKVELSASANIESEKSEDPHALEIMEALDRAH
ncbi:MAG: sigma-54 dependent transcriptional regulator, partial [Polyangiaceae bacterium]|nr:sigma-54 dependent transcriptional regulator [Polyangiaceae bacterium]